MASPDLGHIGGPQVIPGCIAVKLQWNIPNLRGAYNILHASVPGGFAPTVAIADAILTGLTTGAAWTALQPYLYTGTTLRKVHLLDMRTANNVAVLSVGVGSPGTGTGLPMAPATALVLTLRTARGGPGFRGRAYIPGWSSAAEGTTQVALPATVTALETWGATLISVLAGQGMALSVAQAQRAAYTGVSGSVHAARAAGMVAVTQVICRNGFWDIQRKRGGRT